MRNDAEFKGSRQFAELDSVHRDPPGCLFPQSGLRQYFPVGLASSFASTVCSICLIPSESNHL